MKNTDSGGEPYASYAALAVFVRTYFLVAVGSNPYLLRRLDMLIETHFRPATSVATTRLIPALSAIALGFALLLAVGFAPVAEVHNATHDTRHATGFPCH
jgi:cobalt transporter subunit CbtB